MKNIHKFLVVMVLMIIAAYMAQGQSNTNMLPNGNYKHQIPSSKGSTFKDSFKNDNMIDLSSDNYKQPKYKNVKETLFKDNFTNVQKANTVNSKHPYGL